MSEHKLEKPLNGSSDPPPPAEPSFGLTDPATGKFRPLREMTDLELQRHVDGTAQAIVAAQQNLVNAQNGVTQAASTLSNINIVNNLCRYELQRRQVSICIP
jgi:hypothetical protein